MTEQSEAKKVWDVNPATLEDDWYWFKWGRDEKPVPVLIKGGKPEWPFQRKRRIPGEPLAGMWALATMPPVSNEAPESDQD